MEAIYTAIVGHLIEIITLLLGILILNVVGYVRTLLTENKRNLLEGIVQAGILYVQQSAPHADPEKKLEEAVRAVLAMAKEKGFRVDEGTVVYLIEANLKILKDQFGDAWNQ